jgi:hypothetical protein
VRAFLTTILTGLVLACPFLCGAVEAVEGSHSHHAGTSTDSPSPTHCPEDSDNCFCRGAVQTNDVRVPGIDSVGLPLPFQVDAIALAHALLRPLAHLTIDGTPTGLAAWGDSTTVRARLQNFRC